MDHTNAHAQAYCYALIMAQTYKRDKLGRFAAVGSSKRSATGGKLAKSKWPSIKDAKPKTKTKVKFYPGLGWAPVI